MKKTFIFVLAILMLFGFLTVTCENYDNNLSWENEVRMTYLVQTESLDSQRCCVWPEITDEPDEIYFENHRKSWIAWEEVRPNFIKYTSDFNTVIWYADDFGGVYIDGDGIVNICVVGGRQPMKSDYLIYRKVSYSYKFLDSIYEEIGEIMDDYSIWMTGVCEKCNRVQICLENKEKIQPLIEHLKSKKLFKPNTLHFYIGENDIIFLYD